MLLSHDGYEISHLPFPPEIRNTIYGLCLNVGKIFPYRAHQQAVAPKGPENTRHRLRSQLGWKRSEVNSYELPVFALLDVSKTTRFEARRIFFSQNTVVLPLADFAMDFFSEAFRGPQEMLWLKSVEIDLTVEDCGDRNWRLGTETRTKDAVCRAHCTYDDRDGISYVGLGQRAEGFHNELKYWLGGEGGQWDHKVRPLLEHTKLRKLRVRLQDSRCPLGCCHMHFQAMAAFRAGFDIEAPEQIELEGFTDMEDDCTSSEYQGNRNADTTPANDASDGNTGDDNNT